MTELELSAMIYLMTNEQFRIWPLFHGMSHRELVRRFPLLAAIRGDNADEECESLRSKFGVAFSKTEQAISVPVAQRFHHVAVSNDISDDNVKDVDPSELETIYNDLTKETSKNRRGAASDRLRHYSESKSIWKHDISWDIILYLISSKDNSDIKDGLYVLEYMIRTAGKVDNVELKSVKDLISARFGAQLVKLSYPTNDRRIPFNSFIILKEITEGDTLTNYVMEALKFAMSEIENDNDYTRYVQVLVSYLENLSKERIKNLCDVMYELSSRDDKTGERAKELHDRFIRLT
ncbi:MAG: hypothetical protein GEU26_15950 [Nitrososphaeraceae archaeon]|nr:hypothetical protein [Nitrososphaeraceae archaeon]